MQPTRIEGTVALVTGANRGIGRALAERLIARGAAKLYATARRPDELPDLGERCVRLELDVTDPTQIARAAERATDLQLLVNNAGVALGFDLFADDVADKALAELEVNYLGPLRMIQRFAPTLAGGTIVNVASVSALANFPLFPTYSATKAALHSLTQGARLMLAPQGTRVCAAYPGPVDTDMARALELDKATPSDVADAILDGLEQGLEEIFPDPFAEAFGKQYLQSPKAAERQVAEMIAGG